MSAKTARQVHKTGQGQTKSEGGSTTQRGAHIAPGIEGFCRRSL